MEQKQTKSIETVFTEEGINFQASIHKFPKETVFLNRTLALYQTLNSNLSTYPRELIPVPQMFWSCFRNFMISSTLILETHIPEAFSLISKSAEAVAYARKMSLEPDKVEIWLKKDEYSRHEFSDKFGKPFPPNDTLLHPQIWDIYNTTSNFGRHSNFESTIMFTDLGRLNTENKIDFSFCDFEDENNLRLCINYLVNANVRFLLAFGEIFKTYTTPEWKSELVKLDKDYSDYRDELKPLFLV